MNSLHSNRLAELSIEIEDVQGFLAYWQAVCDPELLEEAPGRIAMLEVDLASLEIEHKAITDELNQRR